MHDAGHGVFTEAVQSARIGAPDIDPAVFDFLAALFTKPQLNAAEADFVAQVAAIDARRHGQGRRGHDLLLFRSADFVQ